MLVLAYILMPFILLIVAGGELCDLYERFEKHPKTRVWNWILLPVTLPVFVGLILLILVVAGPPILFASLLTWPFDLEDESRVDGSESVIHLVPQGHPYGSPISRGGRLAREIKPPVTPSR